MINPKEVYSREHSTIEENFGIRWLFELSNNDVSVAGGKGASLAEMYNSKFPVPPAFIIVAQAFEKFISPVKEDIRKILVDTNVEDTSQLNENSKKIRELIEAQKFSKEAEEEILEAYETLGTEKQYVNIGQDALNILKLAKEPIFVAVRSSATTEDLATASFAGQQESFLNVKGKDMLLSSIKKCFSSLYTPRAIYYRKKKGFDGADALLAVVIQRMINSEKSGVMFTRNPINQKKELVIEAVFGLGEGVVSGKIKPDNYIVSKELEITDKKIAEKKKALVRAGSGETEEVKLTEQKSNQQVLSDSEIKRLAYYGVDLEKHYKKPQDIEFAIENHEIYIVQSRPITTSGKEKIEKIEGKTIIEGIPASPGVATGKVKIIKGIEDLNKVEKDDILVTEMTNPDMVVAMQKSKGIITDEGGMTSHAAIVSREMGIACVVGTKYATQMLHEGQTITIDGGNGKVYEGVIGEEKKEEVLPITETKTKIKVILDLPDFAERAAKTGCKEVGLLRLEGIIAESGKHPLMFQSEGKLKEYTEIIEKGITAIASHFDLVWIRTSDIRTDEFRHLQGAPKEQEVNPMLGFHGIRFSLKNKEILEAELLAIKNTAEKFPDKKFGVMFPQIISVGEVHDAKKILEKFKTNNLQVGIMVETPAACEIIEEISTQEINFISFGTNDLTQYTLAVDRGNENCQRLYNEMHPAILKQIKRVIKICKEKGIQTSICGQAASRPEMAKFLVKNGIDSISVNADAAKKISEIVKKLEESLLEKKPREELKEESLLEKKPREELKEESLLEKKTETQEKEKTEKKEVINEEQLESLEEKKEEIEEIKNNNKESSLSKRDLGEKEKTENKEFPDLDIGFDVFDQPQIAGKPTPQQEVTGSVATSPKKEEYPDLGIEFDFFNPAENISGAIIKEENKEKKAKEKDEYVLDIF